MQLIHQPLRDGRDAIGRDQKRKDKEHDPAQRLAADEQGHGKQGQHHTGHNENRSCHTEQKRHHGGQNGEHHHKGGGKDFQNDQSNNYVFQTPDGRTIKSSSVLLRDGGHVIGMLCINYDLTIGQSFYQQMAAFYGGTQEDAANGEVDTADDVTSIIDGLIDSILRGTDAGQMNRKKCVELVRFMDEKGIFLVKGAIDKVAARLGVSKVTIYSYLDEAKSRR